MGRDAELSALRPCLGARADGCGEGGEAGRGTTRDSTGQAAKQRPAHTRAGGRQATTTESAGRARPRGRGARAYAFLSRGEIRPPPSSPLSHTPPSPPRPAEWPTPRSRVRPTRRTSVFVPDDELLNAPPAALCPSPSPAPASLPPLPLPLHPSGPCAGAPWTAHPRPARLVSPPRLDMPSLGPAGGARCAAAAALACPAWSAPPLSSPRPR
jgi:hypothetical protein